MIIILKYIKNNFKNIIRKIKNDFYTKSLDISKSIKTSWYILNSSIDPIQKDISKYHFT